MLYVYVGDIIILKFITNRKTACDTKMLRLHSATNNMTTTCVKKNMFFTMEWKKKRRRRRRFKKK